jgi:hypothetical protein
MPQNGRSQMLRPFFSEKEQEKSPKNLSLHLASCDILLYN